MRKRRDLLALAAGAAIAHPAAANAQVRPSVLVIDRERLFSQSLYGQRVAAELSAESEALASENRSLEAELRAEELSLTENRGSMEVAAFRAAADAFDARVQLIRSQQDAKQAALSSKMSDEQDALLGRADAVLGRLMAAKGADLILDQRTAFVWSTAIDVTDDAIEALDTELGDGTL